ncbi:MAG: T9SS type A sorting domain-containing protein [Paludibacter sp.]|nr:T9SS type A sorting domain-containing protein [Paludibacter sp.]
MKRATYFIRYYVLAATILLSTSIFAQVDYTSRIINSSFELTAEGVTNTGVYRVIVPYGWNCDQNFAINTGTDPGVVYLGNNSQGLNSDTNNKDGGWNYWFSGSVVIPEFVEFYQQIGTVGDYLPAGTYKVSCRMTMVGDKITTQRLFANNLVQYFGTSTDYDKNLTTGETNSYAGYAVDASNPGTLKDMEVTVNLDGNTPLKLGVRTGSILKDGTTAAASNPVYGWFKMDYFKLVKLSETASDASLSDLKVNGNTVAGFDPLVQAYSAMVPAGSTPVITATTNQAEASYQIVGNTVVVKAQNNVTTKTYTVNFVYSFTANWDGSGVTGVGSEPYNFGWRAYMGTTDVGAVPYTTSNVSGYMRYMDNYSTYGANRRLIFLRWDAQETYGNLDGTTVHSYPMTLVANKEYKVTFDYAGQNSGALKIKTGINTERNNSGTSLISKVDSCYYREWKGAELVFTPTESREYYLTIAREFGTEIIFSFSNLLTVETGVVSSTSNVSLANTRIYLNADQKIVISTTDLAVNTPLMVCSTSGQVILNSFITGEKTVLAPVLSAGVYIVKTGEKVQKLIIK